ncbi:MAG: PaaI family thioesterase [Desulfuromonadaceae bacterium]|nr:PaaI family thioesterase [Desulfuromonadaceae bacterium]
MMKEQELGPYRVELDQWIACAPFENWLEMTIVAARQGRAELTMPFRPQMANGGSMLHGGALVSLADTACVMAMKSLVPENSHFATIQMQVDFLAPVLQGLVTAQAQVEPQGDRLWQAKAELFSHQGQKVMTLSARFKMARRQPYDTEEQP